jgi:hypothetical protein
MLASVTKIVDKSFVVGFVIPVLLGVVGILALLRDLDPIKPFYVDLVDAKSFPKLTVVALLLWTAAILLLILNYRLYRILEGYSGPFKWTGRRKHLQDEYETLKERRLKTFDILSTDLDPAASDRQKIDRAVLENS